MDPWGEKRPLELNSAIISDSEVEVPFNGIALSQVDKLLTTYGLTSCVAIAGITNENAFMTHFGVQNYLENVEVFTTQSPYLLEGILVFYMVGEVADSQSYGINGSVYSYNDMIDLTVKELRRYFPHLPIKKIPYNGDTSAESRAFVKIDLLEGTYRTDIQSGPIVFE